MTIHGNVRNNGMTAAMRINYAEPIKERTSVLMGLEPRRKLGVIQAAFMLPLFDGHTVDFSITFIVASCYMLSREIK